MVEFHFDESLVRKLPETALGCLCAGVSIRPSGIELEEMIQNSMADIMEEYTTENLYFFEPVLDTRQAYRTLGKDPSRYRPSSEALLRRIVQGKGIPKVNNVVDCVNFMSFTTGFCIGAWDLDQIKGVAKVGVGLPKEPYETIGRGPMNIEGFPVVRDRLGAFGNPTSDSTRTCIREETKRVCIAIYSFDGGGRFIKLLDKFSNLLFDHADAQDLETQIFTAY